MMTSKPRSSESGNAFFIIMVGVVLFGALMFTFTRGVRQGGDNLSSTQAKVMASDILAYTQKIDRVINRLYSKDCSENLLSFQRDMDEDDTLENNSEDDYNPNAPTDNSCHLYHPNGGSVTYTKFNGLNSYVTGEFAIEGIGRNCGTDSCSDLIFTIIGLDNTTCTAINEILGISGIPSDTQGPIDTQAFEGSFGASGKIGDEDASLADQRTACYLKTGVGNIFYSVVLER